MLRPPGGNRRPVLLGVGQSMGTDGTTVVVGVRARWQRARARREQVPVLKHTYDVLGYTVCMQNYSNTLSQLKQVLIKFCCGSHLLTRK
jgi:hypothetical protein